MLVFYNNTNYFVHENNHNDISDEEGIIKIAKVDAINSLVFKQ